MYPNQNQASPTNKITPVEYLNQIAPSESTGPLGSPKTKLIFGLLGGILLLAIILFAFSGMQPNYNKSQQLAARLMATSAVVDKFYSTIKSSSLRTTASELNLTLSDSINQLKPILAKNRINIDKLDKGLVASESTKTLEAKLDNAQLDGNFDQVFANEMAFKVKMILILMESVYKSSSNSEMKSLLEKTNINLGLSLNKLEAFSA